MLALEEAVALGFERGHDDWGPQVLAEVAGGDAHVPALGLPFGPLVVGQGTGRDGVDRLPLVARLDQQLEDVGLPGARGGLDNHVLPPPERGQGHLLPVVGEDEPLVRHVRFSANRD